MESPLKVDSLYFTLGGLVMGALIIGFIARILLGYWFNKNEKNHDKWDSTLAEMKECLPTMRIDIAVIKQSLARVEAIEDRVDHDHDTLVKIAEWKRKAEKDFDAEHQKIRELQSDQKNSDSRIQLQNERIESLDRDFSQFGKLISELRRTAQ